MAQFNLRICPLSDVGTHLDWAHKVISLVDPDGHGVDFHLEDPKNHCLELFHDAEITDGKGFVLPEEAHIKRILQFTSKIEDDDNVLVHCHAGLCRSTAVAFLALIQHGETAVKAMEKVIDVRSQAWPNMLIVELGDIELKMNGELIDFMIKWQDENLKNCDLFDY